MSNSEPFIYKVKEGFTNNYITALQNKLGGEFDGNTYRFREGRSKIDVTYYTILPEFEILVSELFYHKTLIVERTPDGDADFVHINLIKEGQVLQSFAKEEKVINAGVNGVFIYNGLFPMAATAPANLSYKSLTFKLSKQAFYRLMPESTNIYKTLFPDQKAITYHTFLPKEIDSLIGDIFRFKDIEVGKTPLIIARALEVFALLINSVTKLINKDELHGLHPTDFERLLKIRDKLLTSFNQKIVVEEIAQDFGISVSKLKRDFKTLFDTSVYSFYTQAKMDEAQRLLQSGNYTVMQVAFDLGYENLSKFSVMFKKIKGINPSDVLPVK